MIHFSFLWLVMKFSEPFKLVIVSFNIDALLTNELILSFVTASLNTFKRKYQLTGETSKSTKQ